MNMMQVAQTAIEKEKEGESAYNPQGAGAPSFKGAAKCKLNCGNPELASELSLKML